MSTLEKYSDEYTRLRKETEKYRDKITAYLLKHCPELKTELNSVPDIGGDSKNKYRPCVMIDSHGHGYFYAIDIDKLYDIIPSRGTISFKELMRIARERNILENPGVKDET